MRNTDDYITGPGWGVHTDAFDGFYVDTDHVEPGGFQVYGIHSTGKLIPVSRLPWFDAKLLVEQLNEHKLS